MDEGFSSLPVPSTIDAQETGFLSLSDGSSLVQFPIHGDLMHPLLFIGGLYTWVWVALLPVDSGCVQTLGHRSAAGSLTAPSQWPSTPDTTPSSQQPGRPPTQASFSRTLYCQQGLRPPEEREVHLVWKNHTGLSSRHLLAFQTP